MRRTRTSSKPTRSPVAPANRRPLALLVGAALAIAFVTFGSALRAPFDFDDFSAVVGNRSIRTLWPASVPLSPPPNTPVSGRPLVNYSFAINYAFNRDIGIAATDSLTDQAEPISFHAVNILIHVFTALVLFGIIARTLTGPRVPEELASRARPLAAVAALLWMVHPIQSEAVDYLTQRTELLVSACYALVLYASIRAWDASGTGTSRSSSPHARRLHWTVAAVGASVLGMASKEVMVTVPLAVMLYDCAFRVESWRDLLGSEDRFRARRRLYIGLWASTAIAAAAIIAGARGESVSLHGRITWGQYGLSQGWAVAHYLRLVVWPDALTYDYGQAPVLGSRAVRGLVLVTALVVGSLAAWTRPRLRWLGFCGVWFFLLLLPSSSIIPIQTEVAAERRVYLALAGLIVAACVGGALLGLRLARTLPRLNTRVILVGAPLIIAAVLAVLAVRRSAMYTSPEALWSDAAHHVPWNARAFDNLAAAELRETPPRIAAAMSLLTRATAVDSTYVPAVNRLATIALSQDRLPDARALLARSLRIAPHDSAATADLGHVLLAMGQPDSALPYLTSVTQRSPTSSSLVDLGNGYLAAGRLGLAAQTMRRALALDGSRVDAMAGLGSALVEQDSGPIAIPLLEHVVRQDANDAFSRAVLGVAYAQAGRASDAAAAESLAMSTSPGDEAVYVFAGRALLRVGQAATAARLFEEALRLSPTDLHAATRLAMARAALGDRTGAARLLREVLRVAPEYAFARRVADSLAAVARP